MREGSFHHSFSHTLSLQISPNLVEIHWVGLEMLHVIFEVNKVHINDKTSQSSECGGKRTDRDILRARHSASRVSNVRIQKHTKTHVSLYCTSMVRGVICKLMRR